MCIKQNINFGNQCVWYNSIFFFFSVESRDRQSELQSLGLGHRKTRCLELPLSLADGWQRLKNLDHHPLSPRMHQEETGLGAEILRLEPGTQIWDIDLLSRGFTPCATPVPLFRIFIFWFLRKVDMLTLIKSFSWLTPGNIEGSIFWYLRWFSREIRDLRGTFPQLDTLRNLLCAFVKSAVPTGLWNHWSASV